MLWQRLPSNTTKKVDPIAFIAHVDTSPAVTGLNVNPMIRKNYQGGDIKLENGGWVISVNDNPDLKGMIGFDIITTDGSTLLGADNKAGVSEIVDAVNYLLTHPEVKHGDIKICFTPDEEVGRGTEKIDLKNLVPSMRTQLMAQAKVNLKQKPSLLMQLL